MYTRLAQRLATAIVIVLLAGCATAPPEGVPVKIDTVAIVGRTSEAPPRSKVEVTDIRREAAMERTALGVSLGKIDLQPPAQELVRAVVQAKADEVIARQGTADPQTVLAGIRAFDVTTPSTPLYWDIEAKIELVLRVRGRDRVVVASATDRTFVWPSQELIAGVTTEALKRLAAETERALGELVAAR
jgi:hypothetical protein